MKILLPVEFGAMVAEQKKRIPLYRLAPLSFRGLRVRSIKKTGLQLRECE